MSWIASALSRMGLGSVRDDESDVAVDSHVSRHHHHHHHDHHHHHHHHHHDGHRNSKYRHSGRARGGKNTQSHFWHNSPSKKPGTVRQLHCDQPSQKQQQRQLHMGVSDSALHQPNHVQSGRFVTGISVTGVQDEQANPFDSGESTALGSHSSVYDLHGMSHLASDIASPRALRMTESAADRVRNDPFVPAASSVETKASETAFSATLRQNPHVSSSSLSSGSDMTLGLELPHASFGVLGDSNYSLEQDKTAASARKAPEKPVALFGAQVKPIMAAVAVDEYREHDTTKQTRVIHGSSSSRNRHTKNQVRLRKFRNLLDEDTTNIEMLRKLSWSGVHPDARAEVWPLLLGCLPLKRDRRKPVLAKRRREYLVYVQRYFDIPDSHRTAGERTLMHQICVDVPRTHPDFPMFQLERIQRSMERLLYVWAVRHPASGYVQGINDLATPFFVVFSSVCTGKTNDLMYALTEEDIGRLSQDQMLAIEADCFWCLSKLLDGIQDHYTFAQPGIQRMVFHLQELIARIDTDLYNHLQEQQLSFIQFAFRWMNCLLMRELQLPLIVRAWDTYLSEPNGGGFRSFHLYVCAAFLSHWSARLKTMEFGDLIVFLQRLPTKEWTEKDVETILSQAFVFQNLFQHSPHHLQ